jgi:hypothetical protein
MDKAPSGKFTSQVELSTAALSSSLLADEGRDASNQVTIFPAQSNAHDVCRGGLRPDYVAGSKGDGAGGSSGKDRCRLRWRKSTRRLGMKTGGGRLMLDRLSWKYLSNSR